MKTTTFDDNGLSIFCVQQASLFTDTKHAVHWEFISVSKIVSLLPRHVSSKKQYENTFSKQQKAFGIFIYVVVILSIQYLHQHGAGGAQDGQKLYGKKCSLSSEAGEDYRNTLFWLEFFFFFPSLSLCLSPYSLHRYAFVCFVKNVRLFRAQSKDWEKFFGVETTEQW